MLRLSLKRFSFILSIQMTFLICDVVLNSVGPIFKEKNILKFIFFFQDAFLLLSLAFLVYSCYSTYIYQTGLTSSKQDWQFRLPVLITLVYILLSVAVHILTINDSMSSCEEVTNLNKSRVFVGLFIVQKICCPINFYFFKRTTLLISDPRFYHNGANVKSINSNNKTNKLQDESTT